MKNIIHIILLCLIPVCSLFAQNSDCTRTTKFGKAEICLPVVDGYQECYTHPTVKEIADNTEAPMNMVLGYYLNDQIFEKKDSLGLISFDDFWKVYGTKQIMDMEADAKMLKEMDDMMATNFMTKNWESIKSGVGGLELGVEIGTPVVIENYNLNNNSFTLIMLIDYEVEGVEPFTMAMSANGFLISDRMVWMAYYLNYKNEETIQKLKDNSNRILAKLSDSTK